ncbi:MAG: HEAT repeat domain-containing protein, partial [Lentisphaeria bacterium]|nr:HEAT repeat domain-containing protein [Lentisphaeria bacterium]
MAVDGLTKINDPESVEKIRAAMRARTTFQFENAVTSCLANMPAKRTAQIVVGCSDANVAVRRVTTYALGRGTIRRESVTHLLKAIDDPDAHVRFCAAYSLNRFSYLPRVGDALLVRLDREQHPSVRNRIAISLQACFRSKSRWVSRRQLRALEALSACFLSFGENGGRPDADWSFRPVGNALLGLGPRGRDVLENAMNQRGDRQLADFAWRILHVPQTGGSYATCTEAEAEKGYRQHPKHSNWAPVEPKSTPPEPERVPYLSQNFNALTPYAKGKLGDYFHEVGEWRTFGDVSPEPVIQSAIKRGEQGNAVRLQRGGKGAQHTLQVLRIDYRLTNEHAIIEFWAYRATANAALAATWKDSGSGDYYVGVNIGPSGQIAVLDGNRAWSRTDAVIPHGVWQRIRLDIDGAKLTYGVSIGADKLKPIRQGMPLAAEATYNILTFAPQAPEGGIVYLDDVSVTVPNPAK